jgi:nucleotide-binding universal stress UspA family protein
MKLLIACDDATDVKGMVADLRRAGLPASAQAVVLSVADLLPVPSGPSPATALPPAVRRARERVARELEAARRSAEVAAAALRATFPAWSISAEAQVDSPGWAIVKQAAAWLPDLIVVGSHQHSALGRMLLGSVSQAVLAHASRSVRIVRPPAAPTDAPPRLLVGVDGSPEAGAAVARVAARSWPPGTQVLVVTGLDATMASMLELAGDAGDARAAAWRLVEAAAETLRAAGLDAAVAVVEASPKHVLVSEAERFQADAIFIGARGLRGAERFVLGSVSAAVAARAHCSVEVVRR